MSTHKFVFDFDGVWTDAEIEGVGFTQGFLEDLALICRVDVEEVRAAYDQYVRDVLPTEQPPWMFGGHAVAPATVDPYLRMKPTSLYLLKRFWTGEMPPEAFLEALFTGPLYKHNYAKVTPHVRPAAIGIVHALSARVDDVAIVTNSHTDAVQAKLKDFIGAHWDASPHGVQYGDEHAWCKRVIGDARKYVVDPSFDLVPEHLTIPGLDRPVLLRRRKYAEALEALRRTWGCDWDNITVVGDIFELDLALPLALGCDVVLVANEHTPDYERDFMTATEHCYVVDDLAEVVGLIKPGPPTLVE